jgi:hypothetical protein
MQPGRMPATGCILTIKTRTSAVNQGARRSKPDALSRRFSFDKCAPQKVYKPALPGETPAAGRVIGRTEAGIAEWISFFVFLEWC